MTEERTAAMRERMDDGEVRTVGDAASELAETLREQPQAVRALAALAHDHRLMVFRLLVRRGAAGMASGEIAQALSIVPSTLSRYLAQLEHAGLLRSWRVQRNVFYAVDVEGTRRLIAFLTEDCCQGRPEICGYGGGRRCGDDDDPS